MSAPEHSLPEPPRVFISYSHDSIEHCDQVLALAQELRRNGIQAWVDQFEKSPSQGWPLWCARQILDASYVLLICTQTYRKRFLGLEEFGKGRGVKWEAKVIQNILYNEENNARFIPVIFHESDDNYIPETVRDASCYLVSPCTGSRGSAQLRQRLTGGKALPPLGIPVREEAYLQRDDVSVPTAEVWEWSLRGIEKKLDYLGEGVRNLDRKTSEVLDRIEKIQNIGTVYQIFLAAETRPRIRVTVKERLNDLLARHIPFGGREAELKWLDDFVSSRSSGYLFVTAQSGFGKTALFAEWIKTLPHTSYDVCYHFISRVDGVPHEEFALLNLCQQLAAFHQLGGELPTRTVELRSLYPALLATPPPARRKLIVVLDGLDEALNWTVGPDLFPRQLPEGVFVAFSAREVSDAGTMLV